MEKRRPGRPKKSDQHNDQEHEQYTLTETLESVVKKGEEQDAQIVAMQQQMQEAKPLSPYHGKFPYINDEIEKRRYRFTNSQSAGTPVEFSKGRTVIGTNGRLTTQWERYHFQDGEEYDIPVDVAKHVNSKMYSEAGHKRQRCTLTEV